MEPQLPTPHFGPETTPQTAQQTGEVFRVPPAAQETQAAPVEQGRETREVFHDEPGSSPTPAQTVSPPPVPVIDPPAQQIAQAQVTDSNPTVAADDDLIEKEWVEKAKKVVAETRNDPFAQDEAVGRLQADYLQKRYGKTLKRSSEG